MKPAAFSYHRPSSLEEALEQLAHSGENVKVIAGGQSLGPMMNMRLATPSDLVDLNDLTELAYIRDAGDALEIGALTRHHQIEESAVVKSRCPLLAQAAQTIGHYAIRQRGTLGGSLAHADPAAQLALVAVTLGAQIKVVSIRGQRTIPASEFFLSVMATALEPDEIILSVRFPAATPDEGASFQLFNRRHGDFAIVAVAITVALQAGRAARLRVGIAGTGPVPVAYDAVARLFSGRVADAGWIDELAQAVRGAVAPEDDGRIPAEFRREITATLVKRAIQSAIGRAEGQA
ncbi:xanthine dehydrogenase family protein subunit M [Noviherbaspirillum sp.]|jgi:carbon-monoxide dehydrogenase medium subunit|uniref:FAD binding domain-containing protein n=1 Tax=Noviherbaspirillum sp. TaxID=1926288 RepID=UPI0025CF426C|nr:xanthine dehydrogenase family protein subunit M [Noviherbaspirillum sp.]